MQTDRIGKLENSERPPNTTEKVYDSDIVSKITSFESKINELNENYNTLKNRVISKKNYINLSGLFVI